MVTGPGHPIRVLFVSISCVGYIVAFYKCKNEVLIGRSILPSELNTPVPVRELRAGDRLRNERPAGAWTHRSFTHSSFIHFPSQLYLRACYVQAAFSALAASSERDRQDPCPRGAVP